MLDSPLVTIVICTRNRSVFLEKCLKSLIAQESDRAQYEILIVDNGSTDSTASVIREHADGTFVRSIHEPVTGLSRARNTGWQHARGQFVGYIDDDAVAGERWVQGVRTVFETVNPHPHMVGGPIFLEWETRAPDWMDEELSVPLGWVYWGDQPCRLSDQQRLGGGNSVYPKECLTALGGFDERLGRIGDRLLSGEETQFQKRIEAEGGFLYYHPEISIWHFVPKERTRPVWFYRRYFWGGRTDYIISKTLRDHGIKRLSDHTRDPEMNNKTDRLARLYKNTVHAMGFSSQKKNIVRGRIYMAYVAGWLFSKLTPTNK